MTLLAIRIGLKQIKGIARTELDAIAAARTERPFDSLADFCYRVPIRRLITERLILCGAFDCFCPDRRALLWELDGILTGPLPDATAEGRLPLINGGPEPPSGERPCFPAPTLYEQVQWDIDNLGLCAHTHPVQLFREQLQRYHPTPAAQLSRLPNGRRARVAGVVLCRMRPPTRSGAIVVFITLEDETGLVDTVLFPRVYEKFGKAAFASDLLVIEGRVQKQGKRALTLIAEKVFNPLEGVLPDRIDGKTGVARRQAVIPAGANFAPAPVEREPRGDEDDSFHPRFPDPYAA